MISEAFRKLKQELMSIRIRKSKSHIAEIVTSQIFVLSIEAS